MSSLSPKHFIRVQIGAFSWTLPPVDAILQKEILNEFSSMLRIIILIRVPDKRQKRGREDVFIPGGIHFRVPLNMTR